LLIRQQLARGTTIAGPDAIIAATALAYEAELFTTNPRHFAFEGLKLKAVDDRAAVS
jgi:predicted nucleic acid-binding protein